MLFPNSRPIRRLFFPLIWSSLTNISPIQLQVHGFLRGKVQDIDTSMDIVEEAQITTNQEDTPSPKQQEKQQEEEKNLCQFCYDEVKVGTDDASAYLSGSPVDCVHGPTTHRTCLERWLRDEYRETGSSYIF